MRNGRLNNGYLYVSVFVLEVFENICFVILCNQMKKKSNFHMSVAVINRRYLELDDQKITGGQIAQQQGSMYFNIFYYCLKLKINNGVKS